MRILLLNQVFYPDVAATAQHADDLARHLVKHGHEVHAVASRALYGKKGAGLPKRETVDGVEIHRVGVSLFGKSSVVARLADFLLFYALAAVKCFTLKKPDVVVCFTTPPFIPLVGWLMRLIRGSRYVYWVMDLYPDTPVAVGMMKERAPLTRVFESFNRFLLKKADRVVVLGRCMLERVRAKGVDRGQIQHIGVWSDASEVEPIARDENPYRAAWDLGDRFVVMYSGNFGLGHDVETFLEGAKLLKDDDGVRFVFVGGGKKKARVKAFVREHELTNCVLAGYQPREKLGASLSCADVHLATLIPGADGVMVPCKLFGIMAAERPAIFIGHPSSELARVLEGHQAGFVITNGDAEGLAALLRDLAREPERAREAGRRARRALALAYGREEACERWRKALEDIAARRPLAPEDVVQTAGGA